MTVVLHVSPHADDEMLGCPGLLLALRDGGARVVNLLLNLSSAESRGRRTEEARAAHRRSGLELRVLDPALLPPGGAAADPAAAEAAVAEALERALEELAPDLVVGPQPHDVHEAHELTGRAILAALPTRTGSQRWWMWGLWAELALPTLMVPYGRQRVEEILDVLAAYEQELIRNDYAPLVEGRGMVSVAAGSERIFGFGARRATAEPFADLVTEVVYENGGWFLGAPTIFAGAEGLPVPEPAEDVTAWLSSSTAISRLAAARSRHARFA